GGPCADLLDCVAGLGCDPSTHTCQAGPSVLLASIWQGEVCTDEPSVDGRVHAYFEVPAVDGSPPHDFFRLPFPNDIRRDAATGKPNLKGFPHPGTALLGFDLVDRYARAAEQDLDGFGVNTQVYFRFSDAFDLNSVSLESNVIFVDLATGDGPGYMRWA